MKKLFLFLIGILSLHIGYAQIDSLDIKIGQMIMVGMSGNTVTKESKIIKDVQQGIVGGILLFEYNIKTMLPK